MTPDTIEPPEMAGVLPQLQFAPSPPEPATLVSEETLYLALEPILPSLAYAAGTSITESAPLRPEIRPRRPPLTEKGPEIISLPLDFVREVELPANGLHFEPILFELEETEPEEAIPYAPSMPEWGEVPEVAGDIAALPLCEPAGPQPVSPAVPSMLDSEPLSVDAAGFISSWVLPDASYPALFEASTGTTEASTPYRISDSTQAPKVSRPLFCELLYSSFGEDCDLAHDAEEQPDFAISDATLTTPTLRQSSDVERGSAVPRAPSYEVLNPSFGEESSQESRVEDKADIAMPAHFGPGEIRLAPPPELERALSLASNELFQWKGPDFSEASGTFENLDSLAELPHPTASPVYFGQHSAPRLEVPNRAGPAGTNAYWHPKAAHFAAVPVKARPISWVGRTTRFQTGPAVLPEIFLRAANLVPAGLVHRQADSWTGEPRFHPVTTWNKVSRSCVLPFTPVRVKPRVGFASRLDQPMRLRDSAVQGPNLVPVTAAARPIQLPAGFVSMAGSGVLQRTVATEWNLFGPRDRQEKGMPAHGHPVHPTPMSLVGRPKPRKAARASSLPRARDLAISFTSTATGPGPALYPSPMIVPTPALALCRPGSVGAPELHAGAAAHELRIERHAFGNPTVAIHQLLTTDLRPILAASSVLLSDPWLMRPEGTAELFLIRRTSGERPSMPPRLVPVRIWPASMLLRPPLPGLLGNTGLKHQADSVRLGFPGFDAGLVHFLTAESYRLSQSAIRLGRLTYAAPKTGLALKDAAAEPWKPFVPQNLSAAAPQTVRSVSWTRGTLKPVIARLALKNPQLPHLGPASRSGSRADVSPFSIPLAAAVPRRRGPNLPPVAGLTEKLGGQNWA